MAKKTLKKIAEKTEEEPMRMPNKLTGKIALAKNGRAEEVITITKNGYYRVSGQNFGNLSALRGMYYIQTIDF